MLADEARHPARVPERVSREEALVDHGRVRVRHDRVGHVPALPTGLCGAVAEIDVLAVVAKSGVPATDLVEHRPTHEEDTRRASNRPERARSGARRARSALVCVSYGGRNRRSGVRRTIVPRTVGNLRRDGCHVPSGQRICGPAIPQRGCSSANATSAATACGSGIASGLTFRTYSPLVAAIPRLTFAASGSGRGFSRTRTPSGTTRTESETFAMTSVSSTCETSAGRESPSWSA